ncbi:MAG TPA: hypothetical protein VHU40_20015 [Polyangia bacterium]|nr:hypothetical protein [Polyangia bacterium]
MKVQDPSLDAHAFRSLGPAMRFVLALATRRARERALHGDASTHEGGPPTALLWDLAERHHPEEAWLAESVLRGERSLDELERGAPREGLAPAIRSAAGSLCDGGTVAPAGVPPGLALFGARLDLALGA